MTNQVASEKFHIPVLLTETLKTLQIQLDKWYIDATLGGGGHSLEILKQGGKVIGIDRDKTALVTAKEQLKKRGETDRFKLIHGNFRDLKELIPSLNLEIKGILFDLGVSSHQLGGNERGFSFQVNEPLDMRMDPNTETVTAKDLINGLYEPELQKLITTYSEDPLANAIARDIVLARKHRPIETTQQLATLIERVYRKRYHGHSRLHPATKTFQALRIAVNDEINNLKKGLDASLGILITKGRCVVISFHGLEDKIVKNTFRSWEAQRLGKVLTTKPLESSEKEVANNPRSRSAKLRAFEKN